MKIRFSLYNNNDKTDGGEDNGDDDDDGDGDGDGEGEKLCNLSISRKNPAE